ncbi:MAG: hypothetical protein IKJ33_03620 [Clostridia bacterium]|nr:hypothetical protein [Clostridia bacterium]
MEDVESYLNLNISYKDFYIQNNIELSKNSSNVEDIYIAVSLDVDIVFSALNILPSKSGYLFWKDAIFLYLISGKQKLSICNDIYPLIAKKYETTKMCVDRAMRRCFENVLYFASKNENNFICSYLKNSILYPHNSELIVKIVELISSKNFQQKKVNIV